MVFHWKNHCFLKTCPSWERNGTNDTRVVPLSAQATWDLCRAPGDFARGKLGQSSSSRLFPRGSAMNEGLLWPHNSKAHMPGEEHVTIIQDFRQIRVRNA